MKGIEPSYAAWEAAVLPLNYTRVIKSPLRILLDLSGRLKVITVSLNGETRQFDSPIKIAQLLDQLGLTGKRLAVERNGEIVPKSQHAETVIEDGDALEIVVAVGGG